MLGQINNLPHRLSGGLDKPLIPASRTLRALHALDSRYAGVARQESRNPNHITQFHRPKSPPNHQPKIPHT